MTDTTLSTIGEVTRGLMSSYEIDESATSSSKHLSYSESQKYCEGCQGLSECQYGEGGRGYQALKERYLFGSEEVEYRVYRKCRHQKAHEAKARRESRFKESGLPEKYRALRIKGLEMSAEAKRQCGAVVVGAVRGIVVRGARAAIAIGNEIIARGEKLKYVTASELVTELRYDNAEYQERLKEYVTIDTLIIVGVGSERYSEYNEEQLAMVIERRQRRARRTVVAVTRQREEYESLWEELQELEAIEDQGRSKHRR